MAEKDDNKWILLASAFGLGLFFLSRKHAQAQIVSGNNPAIPPPSTPPATPTATPPPTNMQLIESWNTWIHNLLAQYGYTTVPAYVTSNGATENIVDATNQGRNLVARDQARTDNFLHFMWDYNFAKVFHTVDPETDAAFMQKITNEYHQLQQDFTPQFLQ